MISYPHELFMPYTTNEVFFQNQMKTIMALIHVRLHKLNGRHKTKQTPLNKLLYYMTKRQKTEGVYLADGMQVENEELKHILWTSVLFYRSPDVETTACVLLSTKAIYFILDDTASSLTNQSSEQNLMYSVLFYFHTLFYSVLHIFFFVFCSHS